MFCPYSIKYLIAHLLLRKGFMDMLGTGTYEIDDGWEGNVASLFTHSPPSTWIFRGQPYADKPLSTSLERTANNYSVPLGFLPIIEHNILDDFKRTSHNHLRHAPDDDNDIEWLSIIQHHGGVTRLLDFTYSFYIAMYFAIESSINDGCVWCINRLELTNSLVDTQLAKYRAQCASVSDAIAFADLIKIYSGKMVEIQRLSI